MKSASCNKKHEEHEEHVWKACCEILGQKDTPLDAHASLLDLGIDSLGLAELVIQLEEIYSEGCVSVDDILANPVVSQIAAKLGGGDSDKKPAASPVVKAEAMSAPTFDGTPRAIFLFAGEGAHSAGVDLAVLKTSPAWATVDAAMLEQHGTSTEEFLKEHLGDHTPPHSPVVTTILNLLQADLWRLWGRECTRPKRKNTRARPSTYTHTHASE